jgi:large subunit ribosomal protein L32e
LPDDYKPDFRRQETWRLKRVKENWRRPRGVTSRMRKEKAGWPPKVKAGYGTKASGRGLHPRGLIERLVKNESDLEGLDPKKHIVRLSARLGERRRLILLDRVKALNVHVANPGKEEARSVGEEREKADQEEQAGPVSTEESATAEARPEAEAEETTKSAGAEETLSSEEEEQ